MHPFHLSRPAPSSLRRSLARAVLTPVLVVGGLAAGYGIAGAATATGLIDTTPGTSALSPEHGGYAAPRQASAVADLYRTHDCWTDSRGVPDDLRGLPPGHVIVTPPPTSARPDPRVRYSATLVGDALEHLFGRQQQPGMVVHAFCR